MTNLIKCIAYAYVLKVHLLINTVTRLYHIVPFFSLMLWNYFATLSGIQSLNHGTNRI